MFDFTLNEVLAFIKDLLLKLKQFFADMGILILPEPGEGHNTTQPAENE